MRRSFKLQSGFILIDILLPVAIVATVAGLSVDPSGKDAIASLSVEFRNIVSVIGASFIQALRLRLTNIRKSADKAWLPGNIEQSLLAGAMAFVVLAFIHNYYGNQVLELDLSIGIIVGWTGAEAVMILVDKYILKKINIDLGKDSQSAPSSDVNTSNQDSNAK